MNRQDQRCDSFRFHCGLCALLEVVGGTCEHQYGSIRISSGMPQWSKSHFLMVPACGDIVSTIDDLLCEATTQCHTHSILQELLGVEAFQGGTQLSQSPAIRSGT